MGFGLKGGGAEFTVVDLAVENDPDHTEESMRNRPDGFLDSEPGNEPTEEDLEETIFGAGCSPSGLSEQTTQGAITGRGSVRA